MRTKVIALVVVCLLCVFSVQAQKIKEVESSIILNEEIADVDLVVENPNKTFIDKITLEIIDNENKVRGRISQDFKINKGKNKYKLSLPLGDLMQKNEKEVIWYRLRSKIGNVAEIISLSELLKENFELRVIATDNILSGMIHRSRIRAIDPLTKNPVKDVLIKAEMELELSDTKDDEEDELIIKAQAKTDEDGFAVLDFKIPSEVNYEGDGDLRITGQKNGLIREVSEDLDTQTEDFSFLMMIDKPIYQPEQELKIRGVLIKGGEDKLVVMGEEVEFKIEDEEDTLLYREKVKTSEFGIASISWKIPENAKLGNYTITVKNKNENYLGSQSVKISRYDLPNFVVKPKPDKTYYLPNEKQAEVEVRADYLFGKPVTKGKIRIVQENSREWNWKEQKYEIDEGQVKEGDADAEGKFTAKFDLTEAHEDLKNSSWSKFTDVKFTAYFTDLTTNKTEQRRFDIRVTKEPIHVYFIGNRSNLNPKLPVKAYVSTFYADGAPAVCDVQLKGREDDTDDDFKQIQNVKTNSYGAGKFDFMRPKFEDADDDDDLEIRMIADDGKGKKGTYGFENRYGDEIDFDGDETLQIQTKKTIYKPGETVKIEIASSLQKGLVYVDIVKGWSVIDSYFVDLKKGKAELKIPYNENFQGELKVAAYSIDEEEELVRTTTGIIFPSPQNLQLQATFDKETYKPAEEAKVSFSVLDKVGTAVESALGVVVFDKAVEERAKTDSEFGGGMFRNFQGWLGYGKSFGNINVKDLNELDLSKPISDELQLVAEAMLHNDYYYPNIFGSRDYETDAKSVYAEYFKGQFTQIENALKDNYQKTNSEHPTDEISFKQILDKYKLNFEALRDPWEQKYHLTFDVNKTQNVLSIKTSGADKTFGTGDDFIVSTLSFNYFTPTGKVIDTAVSDYYKRTGKFIRDEKTLLQELGVSELKDRFGRPYRIFFEVQWRKYQIRIRSLGNDGVYEQYNWRGDDFDVWTNSIDYFADTETKIGNVMLKIKNKPLTENEFIKTLSENSIEFEQIKDGYGRQIYLQRRQYSRFWDKVEIENISKFGEDKTIERKKITPVTQEVVEFTLRSKGENGDTNLYDDFTLARYIFIISEQSKDDEKPRIVINEINNKVGTGSISGTITDQTGAIVPGVTVTAKNEKSEQIKEVTSNDSGEFLITNLAVGSYTVKTEVAYFQNAVKTSVPVTANSVTNLDFVLEVGDVTSVVEVTASTDDAINTTDSAIGSGSGNGRGTGEGQVNILPINGRNALDLLKLQPGIQVNGQRAKENVIEIDGKKFTTDEYGKLVPFSENSTPRLREYFPETLYWSPEIITDKNGKAELKFKMADNITTWKLYTIASTKDGKIGVAEKEVQAFQPFFADLEPPKFLTQGDEIYLPTQVRNYTNQKQKVNVTMAKSDWFSFLDTENRTPINLSTDQIKKIEVEKGESENAVFGFRADKFIKGGKQKVTAIAETDSDAIEKPVTVRPNGQEIVKTSSKLFKQSTSFDVDFPTNALAETPKAELKIYPNLFAHVAESVEGLLQRPYGCGEQTISSTYPNLMILKFTPKENKLRMVANKFLQKGFERLIGYQVASGGFSYWGGKDSADIALTAYAIRFLNDAKAFITVDENIIKNAEKWLISQQKSNGSWTKQYNWENAEDKRRTMIMTSYVAKTLAASKTENKDALQKSLAYLKTRNEEIDEPYALALFGLASIDSDNLDDAKEVAERLANMSISENNGVYWKLETNTPFYGWGTAGRIETTALVVQFLTRTRNPKYDDLIARGTQFLLKNKDRYGVWYSTQTTINVLDAFLATLAIDEDTDISQKRIAEIFINNKKVKTYDLPPKNELANPINLDLSSLLTPQNNLVEVRSNDQTAIMSQVVQEHYIDWKDADISNRDTNQSRQIKLDYHCDKLNTKVMEDVTCDVKAERIGFRGYGMLLAEIGIPPGADVSRESLENALETDWSFSRYDILPDRIIVYMWAKAGGTSFKFKFKPRYGIKAQTPASIVYDYYNEEAKATIAPMKFEVK